MKVVGLFSGVGGLELGLKRAGHETVSLCESDPAAQHVLRKQFQDIEIVDDVRRLRRLPPEADILAAGFPCQDLSQAGTTNGINGGKSGVVSDIFRLLRRKRVPWILIENVPFMLRLNGGAAIHYLVSQFEKLGYRWAYRVVDSHAFGLPQRRLRVYLMASCQSDPASFLLGKGESPRAHLPARGARTAYRGRACGFYWTEGNRGLGWAVDAVPPLKGGSGVGIPSAPAIWLPDGRIVVPDIRDAERLQGLSVDWTKPAENVARPSYRWRLVGNAVTVRVARWLGSLLGKPCGSLHGGQSELLEGDPWPNAAFGSREGRFCVQASAWPVARKSRALDEFLRFPARPLSKRALAGFTNRLKKSRLHYPAEFLAALESCLLNPEIS